MTSTEEKNTSEDAEMADCDGEKVVTMMDVLQEQEDFEDDANAVLGASDEKNCTYSKGYIKRQAIYACMTCCSEAKDDPTKRAGVCLACSLTCHENHDLIELYTKRNFKCDCGNPKFNSHPCQFTPDKADLNEENNYNQNFSGVYCVCQRPYPDPESPTDVEMIQCIVCEDWLHATHLEATVPDSDQYSEMICKGCMEKNEFLHDYSNLTVNIDVDVVTNGIDNEKICNGDTKLEAAEDETVKGTEETNSVIETKDETKESLSEKTDEEKPKDAPMETEENEMPTQKDIEDSTEKANKNKTPDIDIKNESISKEQENENDAEPEKIEKSAEQLEEEKLLADPDDDTKKSEEKDDTKKDEPEKYAENAETSRDENDTAKDGESKLIEDKPNDCNGTEGSAEIGSEKQVDEKVVENSTAEEKSEEEMKDPDNEPKVNGEDNKLTEKRKLSTEENIDTGKNKKAKLEETKEACVRPRGVSRVHKGATFWPSTFRQKLCTCSECIAMYKDLSVLFLIDPEDTVTAYETLGKQKSNGKPASQYEKGLAALSSLDRIQQINALTEYNKMRDKLLDFLQSFKDRREVVKEEDIKAFFAGMKPKREPDGVYFCR